ncbi:MAG: hypothetical protein QG632_660, partial [Candidatus Dependentiae bacterium]|nr:hypothetical protein [Candidatus Dependentiae bacterium]
MIKLSLQSVLLALACLCLPLQPTAHTKSPLIPGTATVAFGGLAAKCMQLYRAKEAAKKAFLAKPCAETEEAYVLLQQRFSLWKKVLVAAFGGTAVAWFFHLKGGAEQPAAPVTPRNSTKSIALAHINSTGATGASNQNENNSLSTPSDEQTISNPIAPEAPVTSGPTIEPTAPSASPAPSTSSRTSAESSSRVPSVEPSAQFTHDPDDQEPTSHGLTVGAPLTPNYSIRKAPESTEEVPSQHPIGESKPTQRSTISPATPSPRHTPAPQDDTDNDADDESDNDTVIRHTPIAPLATTADERGDEDKEAARTPSPKSPDKPEAPAVNFEALMKAINTYGLVTTIEQALTPETVNMQDQHGLTPLAKALSMDEPKAFNREWLVKTLTDTGADITRPLTFLRTTEPMLPLFYAIEHCNLSIQKELITEETANQEQAGVFPVVKLFERQSSYRVDAQRKTFLECFTSMLECMQDPNQAKRDGQTLLIVTLTNGTDYNDILECLLTCKKIRRDRATNGQSPFEVALQQNHSLKTLQALFCEEDKASYSLRKVLDSNTRNKEALLSFLMDKGIAPQAGDIKKAEEMRPAAMLIQKMKAARTEALRQEAHELASSPDHSLDSLYTKLDEFAQENLTLDRDLADRLICINLDMHPRTMVNARDVVIVTRYGLNEASSAIKRLTDLTQHAEREAIREKFNAHNFYNSIEMVKGLLALKVNDTEMHTLALQELAAHPGWPVDQLDIAKLNEYPKTQQLLKKANEKRTRAEEEVSHARTIADILALADSLYDTEIRTHVERVIKDGHAPTEEELATLEANPRYTSRNDPANPSVLDAAKTAQRSLLRKKGTQQAIASAMSISALTDIHVTPELEAAWEKKLDELLEGEDFYAPSIDEIKLLVSHTSSPSKQEQRQNKATHAMIYNHNRISLREKLKAARNIGDFMNQISNA